jgi:hypothetical protein
VRARIIYHQFGPNEYFLDGKPVSHKKFNKAVKAKPIGVPMLAGNTASAWPMKMESLAVHPSQIKEAMERNKKYGVTVSYDKNGTPIVPDRAARRDLMKVEHQNIPGGIRDRSGGYGEDFTADALPKRQTKLSEEAGIEVNAAAMTKAAIKKFTGKG